MYAGRRRSVAWPIREDGERLADPATILRPVSPRILTSSLSLAQQLWRYGASCIHRRVGLLGVDGRGDR
jgi:hypothetical protein